MGGCLILESLVLFHFCERNGFGPLGVSGLSMGGHVSELTYSFLFFLRQIILYVLIDTQFSDGIVGSYKLAKALGISPLPFMVDCSSCIHTSMIK